ncbi:MAG: hypothetical protein U1F43_13580 [Myxococcota bacterium]
MLPLFEGLGHPTRWSLLMSCLAWAACSEPQVATPAGSRVAIAVAPLQLDGVKNATYTLQVTNAAGDTVFRVEGLEADRYGDGASSLAYVGTCDTSGSGMNRVDLVLEALYASDGTGDPIDPASYVNPCGHHAADDPDGDVNWDGFACSRTVLCRENADAPVDFDLVIARDAKQGFFDVAIDFQDIFCSAKLDCVPALLNDPTHDGARGPTAVVAFACTAGPGQATTLYMDDVAVECSDPASTTFIDPSRGPGNTGPAPSLFQTAEYFGKEQLAGLAKCYWNSALGLDLASLGKGCTLHARATAAETPFAAPPNTTPVGTSYPVITFDVALTSITGDLVCDDQPHPLGGGNGVAVAYGSVDGERFTHAMSCEDAPHPIDDGRTVCAQAAPGGDALVFTETGTGVVAQLGEESPSQSYDLPDGLHLATCCKNPCCP